MRIHETKTITGKTVHIIRSEEWPEVGHTGSRAQPKPFELAYLHGKAVRLTAVSVVVHRNGDVLAFVSVDET